MSKKIGFVIFVSCMFGLTFRMLAVDNEFAALLNGYGEVPSISTNGAGTATAEVSSSGASITVRLSYSGLGSNASMAHLHLGEQHTSGNVVAFLCGGGGQAACPATQGTINVTLTGINVIAVPGQGIGVNDISGVIKAMRAGAIYVNVHTATHGGGEIRGQFTENSSGPGKGKGKGKAKGHDKDDDE